MSLNKSAIIAGLALVALVLLLPGCDARTTTYDLPPNPTPQESPPAATVPSPLTAYMWANRSQLIRDDSQEGGAVLTVTSSRESTFAWTIDGPDGFLDVCVGPASDCVPLSDDGTDPNPGLQSLLQIRRVLTDPGPTGTQVRVTVAVIEVLEPVDEGEEEPTPESLEEQVVLTVVRPESELAVSISSDRGRIAPHDVVSLTASISGGAPFVNGGTCATATAGKFSPSDLNPPYCITWTLDEGGLVMDGRTGGTFEVDALATGENGETVSGVIYTAPLAVGNVSFRVEVSDSSGNRAHATLAVPINSERELNIAEGTAASVEVAPGRTVELSATAVGGEPPYDVTFALGTADAIGSLLSSGCVGLTNNRTCAVEYAAPDDAVGSVNVRVTIEDAVGAKSTTIIPLTVASPKELEVLISGTSSAVQPNSITQITADVTGGTPPYTVCYSFRDKALGSLSTKEGDCKPASDDEYLKGLTLCTCRVGDLNTDGLETETVVRDYTAPGSAGADRIEVRVTDAVGAETSDTLSLNISSAAGESGTEGTGTVTLTVSVDHQKLCAGPAEPLPDGLPGETATITAEASGGTGDNTYTFDLVGDALPGESFESGTNANAVRTYTAPTGQAVTRSIQVSVTESGNSSAGPVVIQIETINPPVDCDDGNGCTGLDCEWGICLHDILPAGTLCGSGPGGDCSDQDTCDANGVCLPNDASDGDLCDDGLYCNEGETCMGGVCGGGNALDCDDGLACTVDTCDETADHCNNSVLVPGTCLIDGLCRTSGEANPANECQACLPADNPLVWSNKGASAPCGSSVNNACTAPDTCDGSGACEANHSADGTSCGSDSNDCTDDVCDTGICTHPDSTLGTPCGNDADTECDDPDTCDGAGICQANLVAPGSPCGNPTNDDCTDADTCDGAGVCLANNAAPGTSCNDGLYCNENETCAGGVCGGGNALDCSDALACTVDTCNEGTDQCDHGTLAPGTCLIDGVCRANGEDNPVNECQECIPANDLFAWSNKGAGAPCGDDTVTFCTGEDTCNGSGVCRPNHVADGLPCTADTSECTDDVCDTGVCTHPALAPGTACGDPTDTECDDPDTCDAAGTCQSNLAGVGTPCGDPTDSDCDDPDTCDGAGACLTNVIGAGMPCGDPMGDDCTAPDTCNAVGQCLSNDESDGTPCTGDALECTHDECSAGVCTHPFKAYGSACGDSGNTQCSDPDICDGAGNCDPRHEAPGSPCGDLDNTACDNPDTCDGAGACAPNYETPGTLCGDPTDDDCANPDTCDGTGSCVDNDEPDGTACTPDANDCTDDACDGGVCEHPFSPAGAPCTEDGNDCTNDICDGIGVCLHPDLPFGEPCGDPSDTVCTDPDYCDGAGLCLSNDEPDDTPCPDTLFCNGEETCQLGVCADQDDPCVDLAHCNEIGDVCLECIDNSDCTFDPSLDVCDLVTNTCVECVVNADCEPTEECVGNQCVPL